MRNSKYKNEIEMLRELSRKYVPVHILDTEYQAMELDIGQNQLLEALNKTRKEEIEEKEGRKK